MESIRQAVFGSSETTTEPISGEQGAGTKTEPYDKGNDDTANTATANTTAESAKPADDLASQKQPEAGEAAQSTETDAKKDPKIPHTDEEREELMQKGGEFPHDPNDHSGEPLHVHEEGEQKKDRNESVSQEGGNPHGKTLGTGEQYVKSSGLEADGGDFDATNPGAGKEANRLLEQKGIHKDTPDEKPAPSSTGSDKIDNADKPSKLEKLKEKLHLKKDK